MIKSTKNNFNGSGLFLPISTNSPNSTCDLSVKDW